MQITFDAEPFPWHSDKTTWVFVAIPSNDADANDEATALTGGFGSEKVNVQIGATSWSTSLFPSKEMETYVLPLKKAVRQAEGVEVGKTIEVTVELVHT